jgi:hypothetical protein
MGRPDLRPASSNARVAARANEGMAELLRALIADDNHAKAVEKVANVVIVLCRLMRPQSRRRAGAQDGDQSHSATEFHGRRPRLPRPRQDERPPVSSNDSAQDGQLASGRSDAGLCRPGNRSGRIANFDRHLGSMGAILAKPVAVSRRRSAGGRGREVAGRWASSRQ